jgi:ABC-2 type transport system ATP-binding protein
MTDHPTITIDSVSVRRGGTKALRDLHVEIRPGCVTGLLGPSGSGKTTLLRAIVGVQRRVEGKVRVLGHPAGSPSLRNRVAYVTQAPSVYEDLTITENMAYFAAILGADNGEIDAVLDTVDLAEQAGQPVKSLSGGQRSRVSLATALLGDPDVLILDEPTVGLDPVLRAQLWDLFHRLAGQGATLVVSSHVMDEADRCDRVLILREGRLVVDDTPTGMRERTGCERLEDAFLALVREDSA